MVAETTASAILCGILCSTVPCTADLIMRSRRKAHRAWFRDGAAKYAESPESGRDWERALPRLIEDRAISREDAALAAELGAHDLPDVRALPTTTDIDEAFLLPRRHTKRLAALLAVAGAALGAMLPSFGASLEQALLLGAIASTCALMAIIDQRCRIITDGTVGLLCLLGICLKGACGQRSELIPICIVAVLICICMYAADAVYARFHSGRRAFGNGDKKAMAAIMLCSGVSGVSAAVAVLTMLLTATLLICKDRAAKRAFGPYAAAATLVGAIASTTV